MTSVDCVRRGFLVGCFGTLPELWPETKMMFHTPSRALMLREAVLNTCDEQWLVWGEISIG